jgi:hypothetical protein
VGDPEQEVHRPVEGIDDPPQAAAAGVLPGLLAQHPVAGTSLRQQAADHVLGGVVGLGDQVGGRGLGAHAGVGSPEALAQDDARGVGRFRRDAQQLALAGHG